MGDLINGFAVITTEFLKQIPQQQYLLIEIGIIIILSAIFALIAKAIKQPPLIAYVLAGFIMGPVMFGFVKDFEIIASFSEIGIAFLLFLAGLEISFKKLKQVNFGKVLFVGTIQMIVIYFVAIMLSKTLGLSGLQASYIGVALAFGSTMVVVKILSDRGELVTMHGRLILGILLLQDLFAILAIVLLTSQTFAIWSILESIIKLISLLGVAFLMQKLVLTRLFKYSTSSTHSKELLLLSSLAVLFFFILLSLIFQLSIVIGAFIAGVSLANLPFRRELESRISPLRDFFSILFFVALGMQIVIEGVIDQWKLFLLLLIGALIIKPFITMLTLRISGYKERTSFLVSLGLAQLSEFSIIVAILGVSLGVLTPAISSTIIIATIITMSLTSFFIDYQEIFYRLFKKPLSLLNFIPVRETLDYMDKEDKTILMIGCDRMGKMILRDLIKENKKDLVVLDYNPEIINNLREKKISCIYGDVNSPDMLENVDIKNLKKVISTVPELEDGLLILEKIKKENPNAKIILTANTGEEALELYERGADYVMLPRFSAGEIVSSIIRKDSVSLSHIKKSQVQRIKDMDNIFH